MLSNRCISYIPRIEAGDVGLPNIAYYNEKKGTRRKKKQDTTLMLPYQGLKIKVMLSTLCNYFSNQVILQDYWKNNQPTSNIHNNIKSGF